MGIGTSIFLIAIGAILRFAVHTSVSGVSLHTIGVILIVVGAVGLVVSLLWATIWADRRNGTVVRDRYVERDPLV
jgi:protein-S-isoprenylcysteine O-methyltransferase Ste14